MCMLLAILALYLFSTVLGQDNSWLNPPSPGSAVSLNPNWVEGSTETLRWSQDGYLRRTVSLYHVSDSFFVSEVFGRSNRS